MVTAQAAPFLGAVGVVYLRASRMVAALWAGAVQMACPNGGACDIHGHAPCYGTSVPCSTRNAAFRGSTMKSVKSIYKAAVSSTTTGLLALCLALAPSAWALDTPTDPVVLTVSGQVQTTNAGKTAVFSMAMLAKLPQRTVVTKSPWYPAGAEFTGPLLRDVLAAAGAKGSKIVAVALNDYKTDIPFADVTQHDVILARLMNGKPMPVREKGPLFVVYPLDSKPELQSQVYYNRSAWQLARLIIQ